jgi:hypothetical protein
VDCRVSAPFCFATGIGVNGSVKKSFKKEKAVRRLLFAKSKLGLTFQTIDVSGKLGFFSSGCIFVQSSLCNGFIDKRNRFSQELHCFFFVFSF